MIVQQSEPADHYCILTDTECNIENGSGDVFERRRVVALAVCVASAVVPASNTMITSKVGLECPRTWMARSAPPIGRMMVWTSSQTESIQGILSAKNSRRKRMPEIITTIGWPRIASD